MEADNRRKLALPGTEDRATGGLCLHDLVSLSTVSLLGLNLQCGAVTTDTLLGKESQQRPRSRAARICSSVTAAPAPRVSVVSRTVFLRGNNLLPEMLYEENGPRPDVPSERTGGPMNMIRVLSLSRKDLA